MAVITDELTEADEAFAGNRLAIDLSRPKTAR